MPRPRDPDIERIESDTYRRGYAREYKGQWVIFIGSRKIYTGLRPTPATIPKLKKRLDSEIEADMMGAVQVPVSEQVVPTLWDAVGRWYDEHVEGNPDVTKRRRQFTENAITVFKGDRDVPLGLNPGTPAALADRFSRLKQGSELKDGTINQYFAIWKRVLRWCVANGWLSTNPLDLVRIPPQRSKPPDKRRYTREELAGIFREIRRHPRRGRERYHLLLWQYLTGMRIDETLGLRWSDIRTEEIDGQQVTAIEIRGKGHKGRKRMRLLVIPEPTDGTSPVDRWSQQIHRILQAQREASREWRDPSRVWRWISAQQIRVALETAKEVLEIETGDRRAIHTLRAMASHNMRHVLGFSREYAARACGHSETMQIDRYDRELEVQDHAEYFRKIQG